MLFCHRNLEYGYTLIPLRAFDSLLYGRSESRRDVRDLEDVDWGGWKVFIPSYFRNTIRDINLVGYSVCGNGHPSLGLERHSSPMMAIAA
jgi:hypothetical protein